MRPRALDLFCRAGGISEGLRRAGFDVTGVDILDCAKAYNRGPGNPAHENPARFVQADALTYPLEGFDLICASPPCQAHSLLRKMTGKEYPDIIPVTRDRLRSSGVPWCIENVATAPLAPESLLLCGSMFGLAVPDGRAELRRHRLFETSFPVTLRPGCRKSREEAREPARMTQDRRIGRRPVPMAGPVPFVSPASLQALFHNSPLWRTVSRVSPICRGAISPPPPGPRQRHTPPTIQPTPTLISLHLQLTQG